MMRNNFAVPAQADQSAALLDAGVPPYTLINESQPSSVVVICDHASNRIPEVLKNLNLTETQLQSHISHDKGSANLSHRLANMLQAPLILANYSRLVIDLNRRLTDPTAIINRSDGVIIPGNAALTNIEICQRISDFYLPYHYQVARMIERARRYTEQPFILSIHSFTPKLGEITRPWHIGVLRLDDNHLAKDMIAYLRRDKGLVVGDNAPYDGRDRVGYTTEVHAQDQELPNILLEIRDDQLETPDQIEHWAEFIYLALMTTLADTKINLQWQ